MSLGSLVVDLSANTAQFRSDLGKAGQLSNKFTSDMMKNAKIASTGFLALAGAVGTTATTITQMAINNADNINDLSKAAGISTESFSALAYAAKQSGVDIDGLGSGLKKLSMNMASAAGGNKEMQATFAALGINIRDADGSLKSTDQTLSEVADKFSGYADGAEKTALAVQVFGKAGADLIPLLNEGSSGIQSMTDRAAELGIVISQETANAADAFNDKLGDINAMVGGVGTQLAGEFLPTLNNVGAAFLETATETESLHKSAEILSNGLKGLISVGVGVATAFEMVGNYMGAVGAAAVALSQGEFKQAASIAKDYISQTEDTAAQAGSVINKLWEDVPQAIESKAPETSKKLAAPVIQMAEHVKKGLTDAEKAAKEYKERLESLLSDTTASKAANITDNIEFLNQAIRDGAVSAEQAAEKIDMLVADRGQLYLETSGSIEKMAKDSGDSFLEIEHFGQAAAENIQDSLADYLFNPFEGGLQGMLQSFGTMIQKMIAQAVAADIARRLFGSGEGGDTGWVGSAMGSLAGLAGINGGGLASSGGGDFNLSGAAGMFDFARASGGPVTSGNTYLVGERGPEVLTMGGNGHITPNSELNKPINLIVNVTGMSNPGDVRQAAGAGARQALSSFNGAKRYG